MFDIGIWESMETHRLSYKQPQLKASLQLWCSTADAQEAVPVDWALKWLHFITPFMTANMTTISINFSLGPIMKSHFRLQVAISYSLAMQGQILNTIQLAPKIDGDHWV